MARKMEAPVQPPKDTATLVAEAYQAWQQAKRELQQAVERRNKAWAAKQDAERAEEAAKEEEELARGLAEDAATEERTAEGAMHELMAKLAEEKGCK
jgi:thiamine biosynthesis lipoprotein ApbE